MTKVLPILLAIIIPFQQLLASHEPWTTTEYPQDKDKLWWNDDWWENGTLPAVENFDVVLEEITYISDDAEIPEYVFRPKKPGKEPD